jgi:hypothetical protein
VTFNDPIFKAFNDFRIEDMPAQADISRRMLRRLEDIDNASTAGPTAPAARAVRQPASSHMQWLNSRPNS